MLFSTRFPLLWAYMRLRAENWGLDIAEEVRLVVLGPVLGGAVLGMWPLIRREEEVEWRCGIA